MKYPYAFRRLTIKLKKNSKPLIITCIIFVILFIFVSFTFRKKPTTPISKTVTFSGDYHTPKIDPDGTKYIDVDDEESDSTLQSQPEQTENADLDDIEDETDEDTEDIDEDIDDTADDSADIIQKRLAIKNAMKHAWTGYKRYAWGRDELLPITGRSKNWVPGGMALTMIDGMSTLWIMDMKDEFYEAVDWIRRNLSFEKNSGVSFFETTIRVLGGLLSAYDLSGEKILLDKAKDIADRLMPAFESKTGVPYTTVNLVTKHKHNPQWNGRASTLSEVGTVQLEFRRLSQLTGDPKYDAAATKVIDVLEKHDRGDGLYPVFFQNDENKFTTDHITFGAWGDSFYEYLLKQWILTGKTEHRYRRMYDKAMKGMFDKLVFKSVPSGYYYISEYRYGTPFRKMDHLVCFAGGMLALGAQDLKGAEREKHFNLGAELTRTCYMMYHKQRTGLSPELVNFQDGEDFVPGAHHYILRPETVESIFYMWRFTKDPKYREWGWEIFQNIEKYCKVAHGYSGVKNVNSIPVQHNDFQESFFLAETLKYLYLLFDDSKIPLSEWVFNTEAHPLRITKNGK